VSTTRWVRPLAWATLVANATLVVTGGAVRLTGSGLGCPTWPRCTDSSFRPHGALSLHQAVEFGNRTLTFVLVAVAIATLVVMWRTGRRDLRTMALVVALGIPAQAVIGGITVLTDLNPWVVSFHLLCSLAIIGVAVRLLLSVDAPLPFAHHGPQVVLAWAGMAPGKERR
jgi:cytochrome c oxidase assembly protein subunit 15